MCVPTAIRPISLQNSEYTRSGADVHSPVKYESAGIRHYNLPSFRIGHTGKHLKLSFASGTLHGKANKWPKHRSGVYESDWCAVGPTECY